MTTMAAKKKKPAEDVPTQELAPTGKVFVPGARPEFVATPGFVKLQEQIERRKQLGLSGAPEPKFAREPRPIGPMVDDYFTKLRERHGITDEKLAAAREQVAEDEQRERDEMLAQQREGRWKKMCRPRFRQPFDFDLVPADVSRESIKTVLDWELQEKGLFIIGDSGRAKTRAMFVMLRREVIEKNRTAVVLDGIGFAAECSLAFADASETEKWLRSMLKPDIVVIDDLAKRFTPATQQGFFAVLDRRTAHLKPVIITTNCTGDMLEAMINDPQLSGPMRRRMRQYCEVVIF